MIKKRFMLVITIVLGLLLCGSVTTSAATESNQTINVKIELSDQLVDLPIEQVKTMDYALELTNGMFIVNHIEIPGIKEQVIQEKEAYELGFIDNVTENIPEGVDPDMDILQNDKPVIVLGDNGYGHRYKQVISEDESKELEKIIKEIANKKGNKKDKTDVSDGLVERQDERTKGDNEGNESSIPSKLNEDSKIEGLLTPATATNIFNFLLVGLVLIGGGFLFILFERKKIKSRGK